MDEVDINSLFSSFNDTIKKMEGSDGAKFGGSGAVANTSIYHACGLFQF